MWSWEEMVNNKEWFYDKIASLEYHMFNIDAELVDTNGANTWDTVLKAIETSVPFERRNALKEYITHRAEEFIDDGEEPDDSDVCIKACIHHINKC